MALLALQRSVKALLERLEKISKKSLTKRASRSASHKSWWRAENIFFRFTAGHKAVSERMQTLQRLAKK